MPGATTFDRAVVTAVGLLIAAFAFGAIAATATPALADQATGKRDDDAFELVTKDDDMMTATRAAATRDRHRRRQWRR